MGQQQATLRNLRHRRGLTLEAVAYLTNLDQATVSRLERGLIHEPKPETVVSLARLFGVTIARMAALITAGEGESR
jgi:transcriptional regulator with XRE-family HTH domain